MKRYIYKAAFAAMILTAYTTQAKDLTTEIMVDRTIVPVEREANRLTSLSPEMIVTQTAASSLTLADYTTPVGLTRTANVLSPAAYADTFAVSPYKGYAALGYLPAFNLGASAGYRFINNGQTCLNAWMQYDGNSYGSFSDGINGHYSDNTVAIGARLNQRAGKRTMLDFGLNYAYSAMRLPSAFITRKQSASDVSGYIALRSRSDLWVYHANFEIDHFGFGKDQAVMRMPYEKEKKTVSSAGENLFAIKAGIGRIDKSAMVRAGLEFSADILARNGGVAAKGDTYTSDYDKTLGIIGLTPYYAFHSGQVNGRLGAKVEVSTGGTGKNFHIAPSVMLDWNAAPQVALFTRIGGGEHLNTLKSLFGYSHFMTSAWQYERSHLPLLFDAGFNVGPFSGFSMSFYGTYAKANDWLMPQMYSMIAPAGDGYLYNNFAAVNIKGWRYGTTFNYNWRDKVVANVKVETAQQGYDKGYYLWRDHAKYVMKASVKVCPIEPLTVGLSYEMRTNRKCYMLFDNMLYYMSKGNPTLEALSLRNSNLVTLEGTYRIDSQLSAFARIENLLNSHYFLMANYEAQGIKGLVGVTYKF